MVATSAETGCSTSFTDSALATALTGLASSAVFWPLEDRNASRLACALALAASRSASFLASSAFVLAAACSAFTCASSSLMRARSPSVGFFLRFSCLNSAAGLLAATRTTSDLTASADGSADGMAAKAGAPRQSTAASPARMELRSFMTISDQVCCPRHSPRSPERCNCRTFAIIDQEDEPQAAARAERGRIFVNAWHLPQLCSNDNRWLATPRDRRQQVAGAAT